MSFWSGLAQGFKDAEAKQERDDAVERADRIREEDMAIAAEERAYRRQRDEDADRRWQEQFDRNVFVQDRSWQNQMDQQNLERQMKLLDSMPNPYFMGGTSDKGGGAKGMGALPSAQQGVAAVNALNYEIKNAGGLDAMSDSQRQYYETVLDNPTGAVAVYQFLQTNRKAGNNIHISELPEVYAMVGATEGRGQEAMDSLRERLANGSLDLSDDDVFMESMVALHQYKPVQMMFSQTAAVTSPQNDKAAADPWFQAISAQAKFMAMYEVEGKEEKNRLLRLAEGAAEGHGPSVMELWVEYPFAREMAEARNLQRNSYLAQYWDMHLPEPETDTPPDVMEEAPDQPGTPSTLSPQGEVTPPPATEVPSDAKVFHSESAANEYFDKLEAPHVSIIKNPESTTAEQDAARAAIEAIREESVVVSPPQYPGHVDERWYSFEEEPVEEPAAEPVSDEASDIADIEELFKSNGIEADIEDFMEFMDSQYRADSMDQVEVLLEGMDDIILPRFKEYLEERQSQ